MTKSSTKLVGSFKNADLPIKIFLAFINITIFPLLFFGANIVLNYRNWIYLKLV